MLWRTPVPPSTARTPWVQQQSHVWWTTHCDSLKADSIYALFGDGESDEAYRKRVHEARHGEHGARARPFRKSRLAAVAPLLGNLNNVNL